MLDLSYTNEHMKYKRLILTILCLQVTEIFNFTQDDLMTEDIFIIDSHSEIFVWVGQQVDSKIRSQALSIGEVYDIFLLGGRYVLQRKQWL